MSENIKIPKFDAKELEFIGEEPNIFGGEPTKIYNTPVTGKEALLSAFKRKPYWQLINSGGVETMNFIPRIIPDNVARAFVFDATTLNGVSYLSGGLDMFCIEWEYEPTARGSMVRPGNPLVTDVNDLADKIMWPDIDSWDWEGCKEENKNYFDPNKAVYTWLFTGYFERLISLMDFDNASLALIDEDQEDALNVFFQKLTNLYIRIIDKLVEYFPQIDVIYIHDDWGAQKDAFFSPTTCSKMIVPHMKKLTNHIHKIGKIAEFHSCGKIEKHINNIIDCGWDAWTPQVINDTHKLYDEYGDKILLGVMPEIYDTSKTNEEKQRKLAREFANRFARADKPSFTSVYAVFSSDILTGVYREELYKQSRINYSS